MHVNTYTRSQIHTVYLLMNPPLNPNAPPLSPADLKALERIGINMLGPRKLKWAEQQLNKMIGFLVLGILVTWVGLSFDSTLAYAVAGALFANSLKCVGRLVLDIWRAPVSNMVETAFDQLSWYITEQDGAYADAARRLIQVCDVLELFNNSPS